jgi:MATE family multidrug resistance protein
MVADPTQPETDDAGPPRPPGPRGPAIVAEAAGRRAPAALGPASPDAIAAPRPAIFGREAAAEVWSQAWPTVLTMASFTVMQFADKLMVGQVGHVEVAAQGNGGIWAFTAIATIVGFLTVVNTFVSQNLGAGREGESARYAWAAIWLAVVSWLLVLLPLAAAVPWIFSAMARVQEAADPQRLIELQSSYARILLAGGLVTLVGRAMHNFFFGLHRPRVITASAIVGNIANVLANFVLIFGEAGLPTLGLPGIPGTPALGLAGAAIGTLIGTAVEVTIPMAVFLGRRMHAELGSRTRWRPDPAAIRDLLRVGWPAALQYANEIICWAIFMTLLVGRFGEMHMTAGWITLQYIHLSFMPAVGFATATNAIVGRWIGAGRPDIAAARARLAVTIAVLYMSVCAVLFVAFRHGLVGIFVGAEATDPAERAAIIAIGGRLLICAAVFQTLDAVGIVYSGALRGAGDTVWPGVLTAVLSWLVIVGGGLLLVTRAPHLESVGPWIAAAAYIALLGVAVAWRFESGRWRSIDLLGRREASPPPPAA